MTTFSFPVIVNHVNENEQVWLTDWQTKSAHKVAKSTFFLQNRPAHRASLRRNSTWKIISVVAPGAGGAPLQMWRLSGAIPRQEWSNATREEPPATFRPPSHVSPVPRPLREAQRAEKALDGGPRRPEGKRDGEKAQIPRGSKKSWWANMYQFTFINSRDTLFLHEINEYFFIIFDRMTIELYVREWIILFIVHFSRFASYMTYVNMLRNQSKGRWFKSSPSFFENRHTFTSKFFRFLEQQVFKY